MSKTVEMNKDNIKKLKKLEGDENWRISKNNNKYASTFESSFNDSKKNHSAEEWSKHFLTNFVQEYYLVQNQFSKSFFEIGNIYICVQNRSSILLFNYSKYILTIQIH